MNLPADLQEKRIRRNLAVGDAIQARDFSAAAREALEGAREALEWAEYQPASCRSVLARDAEGWLNMAEHLRRRPRQPGGSTPPLAESAEGNAPPGQPAHRETRSGVRFDDVVGMTEAKRALEDMLILPLRHPDKAESLGIRPGGGLLLFGPPGNGKTLLGRALAGELDAPFRFASGADIRSKWHGESEQRLHELFEEARSHPLAVLFLDEIDGLLPPRGQGSSVDDRLVNQFLTEIGGFEQHENTLLLLGATNCPWNIDAAAFRTGRFDRKLYVGPPEMEERAQLLKLHLDGGGDLPETLLEDLATTLEHYTGSDIAALAHVARQTAFRRSVETDTPARILPEDLQTATKEILPSSSPDLTRRFQEFLNPAAS